MGGSDRNIKVSLAMAGSCLTGGSEPANRRPLGSAMRILIYGAGVIGSVYGARLGQAGHDVVFLARAAGVEQLRQRGLQVEDAATGARMGGLDNAC